MKIRSDEKTTQRVILREVVEAVANVIRHIEMLLKVIQSDPEMCFPTYVERVLE